MVSSVDNKRICVGWDIDSAYIAIAQKRLAQAEASLEFLIRDRRWRR